MLSDVPTTLYRRHGTNVTAPYYKRKVKGVSRLVTTWKSQQALRCFLSRQAEGFVLASPTLPSAPKLEHLLSLARLVATLDRRQSPAALVRLARRDAMWPSKRIALWFAAICMISDAKQ
jgi:hypothetical protein